MVNYSIVVSIAAMVILGVLAALFSIEHESLVGGTEDPPPESAPEIVWNIIVAIVIYAVRFPSTRPHIASGGGLKLEC